MPVNFVNLPNDFSARIAVFNDGSRVLKLDAVFSRQEEIATVIAFLRAIEKFLPPGMPRMVQREDSK